MGVSLVEVGLVLAFDMPDESRGYIASRAVVVAFGDGAPDVAVGDGWGSLLVVYLHRLNSLSTFLGLGAKEALDSARSSHPEVKQGVLLPFLGFRVVAWVRAFGGCWLRIGSLGVGLSAWDAFPVLEA